ncbi:kinetochore Sim4 complex subunit FTA2-domain-containing protein [Xylariaceae sp. FL0255]|nr:kinetochore Sim4 complex subunit FTA2-domain-containing protein [Xylariaceae sp. FL0255]
MAPDIDRLLLRRQPIPPCEGPKLKAFKPCRKKIEFLQLLSCDPTSTESREGHGYVFDVRIGKDRFALKMFKFYEAAEARYEISAPLRRKVSDETLALHSDPFFAECRAYGKISQHYEDLKFKFTRRPRGSRPRPRDTTIKLLAVPCYGYITLAAEYEEMLREKFNIIDWKRPIREDLRQDTRKPFRALVKQLISSQVPVSNPRRMLGDLRQLRKLGIFQRDVYARNYKAGLLVDFSVAWTEPHWCLEEMGPYQLDKEKRSDLELFDTMIKSEKIGTVVRAIQNRKYCEKLRSRDIRDSSENSSDWAMRLI